MMVTGGRALTGFLITAVAVAGALLAGTVTIPGVERPTHSVTVKAQQTGERGIVCSGPFAELGADPERPGIAVPVGSANVVIGGDGELSTLERSEIDELSVSGVGVVTGAMSETMAAAQSQQLSSPTLRGLVASSCVEPVNEQWLVGGGSAMGETTTLNLGNTSDVPSTVQITVFDENGEIDALQTAGVIVAPFSAQVVSLNGYAPTSERIAVRVTSTGAPVSASLGITKIDGITPMGAATVTRQLRAAEQLVIPAVTSEDNSNHDAPESGGAIDRFPVRVHAIAPGTTPGTAVVAAVDSEGTRFELGEIELAPNVVGELIVPQWPENATALLVEADVPVYAAAEGTANSSSSSGAHRDFDWFSPAPALLPGDETSVPIVGGGSLIVANLGPETAKVTATREGSKSEDALVVVVPAGAAVPIDMVGVVTLVSDSPVYAGVRLIASGAIAGYPVVPTADNASELTIYTQ